MFNRSKKPAMALGLTLMVSLACIAPPVFALEAKKQIAQSVEAPVLSEDPSEKAPNESSPPHSLDTLSAEAQSTAKALGLWDSLVVVESLRQQREAGKLTSADYLEARQNLIVNVMVVTQDVRTFVHFLEEEIAKADSINAMIAARRDRALKLNTYGDLISGGITGIIGGGLQLADVHHVAYDTIDTVEGAVQTALALMSLREQQGEKRIEKGIPNILARLFEPQKGPSAAYPAYVWKFLNAPASQRPNAETRREKLVNEWNQNGLCISHHHIHRRKPKAMGERRERLLNSSTQNYRVTAELIEDRTAMLHQLRSTVLVWT